MANGTLGQAALTANTDTTVYTPSTVATVNVSLINKGASPAAVRLAVAASGTPSTSEDCLFLEFSVQALSCCVGDAHAC